MQDIATAVPQKRTIQGDAWIMTPGENSRLGTLKTPGGSNSCQNCSVTFSRIIRKHSCGECDIKSVCGDCSQCHMIVKNGQKIKIRLCHSCINEKKSNGTLLTPTCDPTKLSVSDLKKQFEKANNGTHNSSQDTSRISRYVGNEIQGEIDDDLEQTVDNDNQILGAVNENNCNPNLGPNSQNSQPYEPLDLMDSALPKGIQRSPLGELSSSLLNTTSKAEHSKGSATDEIEVDGANILQKMEIKQKKQLKISETAGCSFNMSLDPMAPETSHSLFIVSPLASLLTPEVQDIEGISEIGDGYSYLSENLPQCTSPGSTSMRLGPPLNDSLTSANVSKAMDEPNSLLVLDKNLSDSLKPTNSSEPGAPSNTCTNTDTDAVNDTYRCYEQSPQPDTGVYSRNQRQSPQPVFDEIFAPREDVLGDGSSYVWEMSPLQKTRAKNPLTSTGKKKKPLLRQSMISCNGKNGAKDTSLSDSSLSGWAIQRDQSSVQYSEIIVDNESSSEISAVFDFDVSLLPSESQKTEISIIKETSQPRHLSTANQYNDSFSGKTHNKTSDAKEISPPAAAQLFNDSFRGTTESKISMAKEILPSTVDQYNDRFSGETDRKISPSSVEVTLPSISAAQLCNESISGMNNITKSITKTHNSLKEDTVVHSKQEVKWLKRVFMILLGGLLAAWLSAQSLEFIAIYQVHSSPVDESSGIILTKEMALSRFSKYSKGLPDPLHSLSKTESIFSGISGTDKKHVSATLAYQSKQGNLYNLYSDTLSKVPSSPKSSMMKISHSIVRTLKLILFGPLRLVLAPIRHCYKELLLLFRKSQA